MYSTQCFLYNIQINAFNKFDFMVFSLCVSQYLIIEYALYLEILNEIYINFVSRCSSGLGTWWRCAGGTTSGSTKGLPASWSIWESTTWCPAGTWWISLLLKKLSTGWTLMLWSPAIQYLYLFTIPRRLKLFSIPYLTAR